MSCEPWADDPAEWCNWAPDTLNLVGAGRGARDTEETRRVECPDRRAEKSGRVGTRFDPDAELRIIAEDLLAERLKLKQVAAVMHITPEAVRRLLTGGRL